MAIVVQYARNANSALSSINIKIEGKQCTTLVVSLVNGFTGYLVLLNCEECCFMLTSQSRSLSGLNMVFRRADLMSAKPKLKLFGNQHYVKVLNWTRSQPFFAKVGLLFLHDKKRSTPRAISSSARKHCFGNRTVGIQRKQQLHALLMAPTIHGTTLIDAILINLCQCNMPVCTQTSTCLYTGLTSPGIAQKCLKALL